jgi:hypothetical protein
MTSYTVDSSGRGDLSILCMTSYNVVILGSQGNFLRGQLERENIMRSHSTYLNKKNQKQENVSVSHIFFHVELHNIWHLRVLNTSFLGNLLAVAGVPVLKAFLNSTWCWVIAFPNGIFIGPAFITRRFL